MSRHQKNTGQGSTYDNKRLASQAARAAKHAAKQTAVNTAALLGGGLAIGSISYLASLTKDMTIYGISTIYAPYFFICSSILPEEIAEPMAVILLATSLQQLSNFTLNKISQIKLANLLEKAQQAMATAVALKHMLSGQSTTKTNDAQANGHRQGAAVTVDVSQRAAATEASARSTHSEDPFIHMIRQIMTKLIGEIFTTKLRLNETQTQQALTQPEVLALIQTNIQECTRQMRNDPSAQMMLTQLQQYIQIPGFQALITNQMTPMLENKLRPEIVTDQLAAQLAPIATRVKSMACAQTQPSTISNPAATPVSTAAHLDQLLDETMKATESPKKQQEPADGSQAQLESLLDKAMGELDPSAAAPVDLDELLDKTLADFNASTGGVATGLGSSHTVFPAAAQRGNGNKPLSTPSVSPAHKM